MANIRVDVSYMIQDGSEIVFRSPVDCSAITGLIVYYPGWDGNTTSMAFALADAHGNNVGDIDHLFSEDVVVKVILDVTHSMAYVQNADTNAYLEGKFAEMLPKTDLPVAVNEALEQAKASGVFDGPQGPKGDTGEDGKTPTKGTDYFTPAEIEDISNQAAKKVTLEGIGAAPSEHNHSASNINSGTLGVARGGTGKATHTSNAVLTGNGTSGVNNVATANGALYATAANGAAKFGTLPVAQGGTGATTSSAALANLGGISIKKLWENASPTSAFAAQTVSLDLSGYDYVIIDAVANVQSWIITQSFVFARNKDANMLIPSTGSLHSRDIHTKNNGIQFDGGNAGQSAINQSCVPIRICGIKGVG